MSLHDLLNDPSRLDLDPETTDRIVFKGLTVHGWLDVDVPLISHIHGNIYTGGCVTGRVLPAHIQHHVSLYDMEEWSVGHPLRSRLSVHMYDTPGQAMDMVDATARWVVACAEDGHVLVNCQAGLNRAGLVTARALQMQGMSAAEAISTVRMNRSEHCLCNKAFEQWLLTR